MAARRCASAVASFAALRSFTVSAVRSASALRRLTSSCDGHHNFAYHSPSLDHALEHSQTPPSDTTRIAHQAHQARGSCTCDLSFKWRRRVSTPKVVDSEQGLVQCQGIGLVAGVTCVAASKGRPEASLRRAAA